MSLYPTFKELMRREHTASERLLVQAIARLSTSPKYTHLTPEEVYSMLVNQAVEVYGETNPQTFKDHEYAEYLRMGGQMVRGEWDRVWRLHKQYIDSDRISPYEEQLLL